jgi:hypothetical protein
LQPPWTKDPILNRYKFTNVYRASDRVSQYLIRNVIYHGDQSPEEVFFRTVLFRIFNRIETWELLQSNLEIVSFADYDFERYDAILSKARDSKHPIFSAAYIMPSGTTSFGYDVKHRNYLKLLETMMAAQVPTRICDMRHMSRVFELLKTYPMLGNFLAYQFTIDLNYSELVDFSEMEFVVPGPGALAGISKCFKDQGKLSDSDLILWVAEQQQKEFERLGLQFHSLWGRHLQLIDCQNLFCEVDKYTRMSHPYIAGINNRKRIKQSYHPRQDTLHYWYPPSWGINHLIGKYEISD